MPVLSKGYRYTFPSYFSSLDQLDAYSNNNRVALSGVVPFAKREDARQGEGRMLVCHDYKGGYVESPSEMQYTFNFWSECDTFVYFSHNRITIPPPQWVNAAHRQGVKMLGVIIFEGSSVDDVIRMITGKLPSSKTGPAIPTTPVTLPVSSHYATLLAELARDRGFDGYLLNVEVQNLLDGSSSSNAIEAARALEAWISLLENELKRVVGQHACVSWYDSITTSGTLGYQNEVNYHNITFFLASSSLFSNYWWSEDTPVDCRKFFDAIAKSLLRPNAAPHDVLLGIDVWGRGTFGGGQFNCYAALDSIKPKETGLSAAVFAPGWTWESHENDIGFNWALWWTYERKLWVGLTDKSQQGNVKPITPYFSKLPAPNPTSYPLLVTFSPGVGNGWYVAGKKVMQKDSGWTDIDKQTSLGNLLWPMPNVTTSSSTGTKGAPQASAELTFDDAFSGGSSVFVTISGTCSKDSIWIPIQSVNLSPDRPYNAELVYKLVNTGSPVSVSNISIGARSVVIGKHVEVTHGSSASAVSDWVSTRSTLLVEGPNTTSNSTTLDSTCDIGVSMDLAPQAATGAFTLIVRFGQISVYPAAPSGVVPSNPSILWVNKLKQAAQTPTSLSDAQHAQHDFKIDTPESFDLSWGVTSSFNTPASVPNQPSTDTTPPWVLDRTPHWFPVLAYSNLYVYSLAQGAPVHPDDALFIGTNGWDGTGNKFYLNRADLPVQYSTGPMRIYVQGVTDRGRVLPWEDCAYVDLD